MQTFISSSVFKQDLKKAASLATELGCNLEISRFPFFTNDEEKKSVFAKVKSDLADFSGELSVHGYFSDLNAASKDKELAQLSQKRHYQTLEFAQAVGAKTILFHTGYVPFRHPDFQRRYRNNYRAFWLEFVKYVEDAQIVAVLENVLEESPEQNLSIVRDVNSNNLKLSIDAGHVNVYSEDSVETWIKAYGNNLYHMHIHNNFGDNDDHKSLCSGTLNFENIFKTIKAENLSPKVILEIFEEEPLRESVAYFKKIIKENQL